MFWRVKEIFKKKTNEKRIIIWNGVLEYTTRCEYFFFFFNVMFIIFSQYILSDEVYKWDIKVKSIKYREHKSFFFFFWENFNLWCPLLIIAIYH